VYRIREPLIKSVERSLARAISNLRGEGFSLKNRFFQRFLSYSRLGATRFCLALAFATILGTLAVACGHTGEDSGKIGVVVTILPQVEFVEQVGGEKVDVSVMVPPGASPHTYAPTPSQMIAVSKARMYAKVGSGIEFELTWMEKLMAQNKNMLIVDCSRGIKLIPIGENGQGDAQGAMDPHIWMSPKNAEIMVQNICAGLTQIDPANQAYYEANRDAYLDQLAQLDEDIKASLSGLTNRVFMVDHPAFGYFAREYNLTMVPIEEEGKEPTSAGLAHLVDQAKEHDIRVIFVSPQFNPQSAKVIAKEIGGEVVPIDHLAKDYIQNMRSLLNELILAMEQK